jgi:outer membrane protein assembly factor BamA
VLAPIVFALALATAQPAEVVTEIVVHGNFISSEEEILRLAQVERGMAVAADTVDAVQARLRASGRFERVEVLKRFASIEDPTQIVLVIVVDDGPVVVEFGDDDEPTRVVKKRRLPLMFMPLFTSEDGYGVAYGVRTTWPNPFGWGGRLSFPATLGGTKAASVEFQQEPARGPFQRIELGASLSQRENPFYDADDDRTRVWARGEHQFTDSLRAGAVVGWERVDFLDENDRFVRVGVDVTFDTRLDAFLARNAVYARAAWERLGFIDGRAATHRLNFEAQGHIGLVGPSVLVLRAQRSDANNPLPLAMQPLLGGMNTLRGFGAGSAVDDTLVAASVEVRVPLTSPLNFGRIGVSAFMDAGTVYPEGAHFSSQRLAKGVGGSVWILASVFRANLAVARGIGGSTRVHFAAGLPF